MIDSQFAATIGEWLAPDGPDNDVVISTRIRLARNVAGFEMPWRLSPERRHELAGQMREKLTANQVIPDGKYWDVSALGETERRLLIERHLISRELARGSADRGVFFSSSEDLSIMINEEDHLRIQAIGRGLQTDETYRLANNIDDRVEPLLPYAVSPRWGYLTACPTNVGTGMRISLMTHLPLLAQTNQIKKVYNAVSKVGLVIRGLYGEGTKASGDFYQISNQVTLGTSEEDLLRRVRTMVNKIVAWERGLRDLMLGQDRIALEDRTWRAYGLLKVARKIDSEETMRHLSSLRLGVHCGFLPDLNMRRIAELFIFTQPAHLQLMRGAPLDPEQRDISRAQFIRDWLR